MSLLITTCTQNGIVMAADSRISYYENDGAYYSDNANKVFVTPNNVGISTCGNADIDGKRIEFFIKEFIAEHAACDADEIANNLLPYFAKLNPELDTTFHVCGMINEDFLGYRVRTRTGKIFNCNNFFSPCGIIWDGDTYVIDRLLNNYFNTKSDGTPGSKEMYRQVPWERFVNEDAVEFIKFMMETSIKMQKFHQTKPTIGGPIRILAITKTGAKWIEE